MYIVLLEFSDNKDKAGQYAEDHIAWLKKGFADGVFQLAGTLKNESDEGLGGAILASGDSLPAIQQRVDEDPFVAENVVSARILGWKPSQAAESLTHLIEN